MYGIENVASFLMASLLLILVPGPATFYVLGKAREPAAAAAAIGGLALGDAVLIGLSGAGFSALVSAWPGVLLAIKLLGAAYVAWLGIGLLRSGATSGAAVATPSGSLGAVFVRGVGITLANPKVILFFSVFFPLFIAKDSASWMLSFCILGLIFEAMNAVYFVGVLALAAWLRRSATAGASMAVGLNTVSGCGLLLCSGLVLASVFVHG